MAASVFRYSKNNKYNILLKKFSGSFRKLNTIVFSIECDSFALLLFYLLRKTRKKCNKKKIKMIIAKIT